MSTIDTVIAAVAANPGTSAGLSPDALRTIWRGTCEHLRTMLERRRSVFIANFAHFVVQKHIGHSGTWGARVTWVPVLALLPAFCQAYGVPMNTQTSLMHQGATSPLTVNTAAVASNCGGAVSRHAVANALKDMVREIGALAASATGRPLTLEMGFCTLVFLNRRLQSCRFDNGFARALNSDANVKDLIETGLARSATVGGGGSARPAGSVSPRGGSATPARDRSASSSRAPSVNGRVAHFHPAASAPAAAPQQKRDGPIPAMHAADAPMPPQTARAVPAPPPKPLDGRAFGGAAAGPHTARPSSSALPPATPASAAPFGASPRRVAQEEDLKGKIQAINAVADASPHRKRAARKLAYRRSRNQAYEDAWEHNRAERLRLAEEEAARDREAAALMAARQAEDVARQRADLEDRRAEGRRVQDLNAQLIQKRRGGGVPRAQGPGDIFDSRCHTARVPADLAALEKQMAERRARDERERAEAAAYGEAAWREQQDQIAEDRRRKEEAKVERLAAQRDYERIVAEKREQARRARQEDYELEQRCTGFEGFGKGGDAFKAQSVQIQKANYEMVRERAAERERREAAEKERLADAVRRIEARDLALREQELRTKRAKQAAMRTVWTDQANGRLASKQREQEERKQWRDVNFLRNESSDDDDTEGDISDRVDRVSKRRPVTAASSTFGYAPRPPSSSPRAVIH